MKPVLLDLFCCAGGAAMGYFRAGYDVVGVDRKPQPNYPFRFILADAVGFDLERLSMYCDASRVSAIHASPPCQWGTAYGRRPNHVKPSPNLITEVREQIVVSGLPYVIEQPEHGRPFMVDPVRYCGSSFGLDVRRHRLFESNVPLVAPECDHTWQTPRFEPASNRKNLRCTVEVGVWRIPLDVQQKAMGVDWMRLEELSQAIPPAYTEYIGRQLLAQRQAVAA